MKDEVMEINLNEVDMLDFEVSYKECFKDLIDYENQGITDKSIYIAFNREGKFSGHLWGNNCAYSLSDRKCNKDFVLSEINICLLKNRGTFENWQEEVRDEIAETGALGLSLIDRNGDTIWDNAQEYEPTAKIWNLAVSFSRKDIHGNITKRLKLPQDKREIQLESR